MKRLKIFFICIFSVLMLLPALFFNWQSDYISEIDNRKLVEFPSLDKINADTLIAIYDYINDRMGFREEIIQSYGILNNELFGILAHPAYIYGQDGYVYFDLYQKNYDEHSKQFTQSIKEIKDYVESKGKKFYVLIDPEKTSVYTEQLPKGTNYNRNQIELIEKDLKDYGVNFIDNTEELKNRSKTEMVYNQKYDAGHWNDLGAFYGVNNLLSLIHKDFPSVNPHKKDDFEVTEELKKYLQTSKFEVNEMVPIFSLKADYTDLTDDYDDEIKRDFQQNHFSYIQNPNSSNSLTALVFQGSYLNGREQYLADRFSEYIAVHNYQNIFDIDYYYNIFQPDVVIFEVAEYTISNMYFASETMANMHLNPKLPVNSEYIAYTGEITYKVEAGSNIATIAFEGIPDDTEYVYLKNNTEVYDVKKEDGKYTLNIKVEQISSENNLEIIFKKMGDESYYMSKIKEEKSR